VSRCAFDDVVHARAKQNHGENFPRDGLRAVAIGRRTRRWRESVPPDSRVLRPKAAVNGPAQAAGAKLFSPGDFAAFRAIVRG
jgi:hypothetical protein